MSSLRQALVDYLAVRRALGYELKRDEKLLDQFLNYLEDLGEERVTTKTALAWATLPHGADRSWWSGRLSIVRGFATHLHAIEPATEVPAADLLPWKRCRATPYLYSDEEIAALIAAAGTLRTPHRVATYRSLIGLLVEPLIYFLAREAKGHGVPEVMEACTGRGGSIRLRVALVKIMASAVSSETPGFAGGFTGRGCTLHHGH